jgi:hypothetical protein
MDCYSGDWKSCVLDDPECPMRPGAPRVEPVVITMSSRGFKRAEPVPSEYGGAVRVYESSSAMAPHLWVAVSCPADLNKPDGPEVEAVAHLTLDNARLLRDQLTYLIEHHYQED